MGISIDLFPSEKKDPIKLIVGNAPENLDTLEEIAAQLKNAGSAGKTVLDFTKITDEEWLQIQQDENYTPDLVILKNGLQVSPRKIHKGEDRWILAEAIASEYICKYDSGYNWYVKGDIAIDFYDLDSYLVATGTFIPIIVFKDDLPAELMEKLGGLPEICITYLYAHSTYDPVFPQMQSGIIAGGYWIRRSMGWGCPTFMCTDLLSLKTEYTKCIQELPLEALKVAELAILLGIFLDNITLRVSPEEFYDLNPNEADVNKYEILVDLPWFGKTLCACKYDKNYDSFIFVPKLDLIHDNIKISNVLVDRDELSAYDSPCKILVVYLDTLLPFITSHNWNRLFYGYHCDIEIVEPGSVTAMWKGILYPGYENEYAIICTTFGNSARLIYIKDGEVIESSDFWNDGEVITSENDLVNNAWDYAIKHNLIQIPENLYYQNNSLLKNYSANITFDTTHEWANNFLTYPLNYLGMPHEIKLPEPFKIKLLSEGVRKDDTIYYEKVTLYQENVWDYTGPLELYVDTDYKVKFRIPENKLDIIINFKTTYETLETMVSNFLSLDFIKNLSENRLYQLNFTTSGATGEWLMYTVLVIEGKVVIMDYGLLLRANDNYLNLVKALSSDPMDDATLGNGNNKTFTYIQEALKYGLFQQGMLAIIAMLLSK